MYLAHLSCKGEGWGFEKGETEAESLSRQP